MSLPTNRMPGDIIQAVDINQIAEAVNALSDSGTSGSGILNVSGTVDLDDAPGIREVYATASATVEGVTLTEGDAAVFRYLAGAWTYMVVGEHTTWQSLALTSVTPATPTADDNADTITWTPTTGVEYVIGGQVRTPPYSVGDVTTSVTVTAQATSGYTLTGTTSWTFNFTGSAPADTTAPTAGTLAVTGSGDAGTTRTLTVTGASDETALHATPYRFSTDGGTTWSAYQASNVFTTGALAAGTYQPRVMVRDAAGNTATATAADFTVDAAPVTPTLPLTDTFTEPDGTEVVGRTVSGFTWALDANNDLNHNATGSPKIIGSMARTPSGGTGAILDVAETTVRVSADVSLNAQAGTGGSVRLGLGGARTSGGSLNGLYVIIEQGKIKTYWDNGSGSIKQIGSDYNTGVGPGQTKTVSVEYVGGTVTTKLDGATANTGAATLTGTRVGFSISLPTSGYYAVDNFTVETL